MRRIKIHGAKRDFQPTRIGLRVISTVLVARYGSSDATAGQGSGPVPVLVAKAIRKTRAGSMGHIRAYSTVEVENHRISGQVMQVHFKEGQDVSKGDLLFNARPAPVRGCARSERSPKYESRQGAEGAVGQRLQPLPGLKEGVGSRQQYDEAKSKYEAIDATVAADEANVQTARLNLNYTRITSPIDGRTGPPILHEGNLVKANADAAMVVINQIKPVYVNFALPGTGSGGGSKQHGVACVGRGRSCARRTRPPCKAS